PAGFAPCPELPALRVVPPPQGRIDLREKLEQGGRVMHHAPGELIFGFLEPGTRIQVEGVGQGSLELAVPPSPVRIEFRRRKTLPGEQARPRIRSVHLDADRRRARVVYGHIHRYHPQRAPHWAVVTSAPGGIA